MAELYSISKALAFLGSLTAVVILVALDHQGWAIYPAVLAAIITGLSVCFGPPGDL